MKELEIKILGCPDQLYDVFNTIVQSNDARLICGDKYVFTTTYYDTPDQLFKRYGFSIRHRPRCAKGRYEDNMELKEIFGQINGVSSRLELRSTGGTKQDMYERAIMNPLTPRSLPRPSWDNLRPLFMIEAIRQEAHLMSLNYDCEVEAVLDKIEYKTPTGQCRGHEMEVEIEHKAGSVGGFMQYFEHIKQSILPTFDRLDLTTESKAQRAFKFMKLERDI